jgi:hypothetical protein
MKEKLKKEEVGFTQIKNEVANDKNLSWKARGIFLYIFSKPDDWDFSIERVSQDSTDGIDSTRSAVKELERAGYLKRRKLGDRRMEWFISHKPTLENPMLTTREKANKGKSQQGKTATVSNKELKTNKELTTNKEGSLSKKTEKFILDFKNIFKDTTIKKEFIPELKAFVEYWTEANKSRTKLRWEMEKTWDMNLRFKKWMRNKKDWSFEKKQKDNKYKVEIDEANI